MKTVTLTENEVERMQLLNIKIREGRLNEADEAEAAALIDKGQRLDRLRAERLLAQADGSFVR